MMTCAFRARLLLLLLCCPFYCHGWTRLFDGWLRGGRLVGDMLLLGGRVSFHRHGSWLFVTVRNLRRDCARLV